MHSFFVRDLIYDRAGSVCREGIVDVVDCFPKLHIAVLHLAA